jgi:predicted dienelactone hydrolase
MLWNNNITQADGPYRVLLKRGELTDASRQNEDRSQRVIPYKLYYPSDERLSDCPVIIWSHGYGGSRDGAGFLARYLAGYGYALLHLTHTGTDSSLWEGKAGHPWEILRDVHIPRQTVLNRYRDIPFVVKQLLALTEEFPDLSGVLDLSRIGMSGHSFGAITAQVSSGQQVLDEEKNLVSIKAQGVVAGIAYSPVPGMSHVSDVPEVALTANIYESIDIPLLHMTGTDDSSPISDMPYEDRLVVYEKSGRATKAAIIKQGGDHMVYNGTRGQLADNPLRDRHEEIIKIVSLAWWEYWLKDDSEAGEWLAGDGILNYLGDDAHWMFEKA